MPFFNFKIFRFYDNVDEIFYSPIIIRKKKNKKQNKEDFVYALYSLKM